MKSLDSIWGKWFDAIWRSSLFLGIFMIKIKCVVIIFIVLGTLKEAYDIKKWNVEFSFSQEQFSNDST